MFHFIHFPYNPLPFYAITFHLFLFLWDFFLPFAFFGLVFFKFLLLAFDSFDFLVFFVNFPSDDFFSALDPLRFLYLSALLSFLSIFRRFSSFPLPKLLGFELKERFLVPPMIEVWNKSAEGMIQNGKFIKIIIIINSKKK